MSIKETILKKFEEKIEKNAFQSTLTYKDRHGQEHTEKVIFKRSIFPLGDWTRIYPPVEEKNGELKIKWFNLWFGGKKNAIKLLIVLAILIFLALQINSNLGYIHYLQTLCQNVNWSY